MSETSVVMVLIIGTIELREVHQLRELIEVEHRLVLAVLTKERDVLAKVHILEVIRNKAAVAPLNALAEFGDSVRLGR